LIYWTKKKLSVRSSTRSTSKHPAAITLTENTISIIINAHIAKERVAELENNINTGDKVLPKLEQKLKELENTLNQEKNSNNRLMTDLSTKAALVLELQKKLEASRFSHDKLKDEVAKSKAEIALLQGQLSVLKTQQALDTSSSVFIKTRENLLSEGKEFERKAEPHNPAAIIDWVLKKKSE
jgi:chromosome segregation ATPase